MIFIGIDPGYNGGIAILNMEERPSHPFLLHMPESQSKLCHGYLPIECRGSFACIERVNAFRGASASSSFTFGKSFGECRMALVAKLISFEEVQPRKWMDEVGLPRKPKGTSQPAWKRMIIARAKELFPEAEGIDTYTADALLIAEYARRKHARD